MSVSVMEKELVAVGVSVAAGCKPCTDYHIKAARKAGVSDDELGRAVTTAVDVRAQATAIMQDYATKQLGSAGVSHQHESTEFDQRQQVLVSIGAAFGVNCTSSLERYLAIAQIIGIPHADIRKIGKLAAFIKGRAASHVENLIGQVDEQVA